MTWGVPSLALPDTPGVSTVVHLEASEAVQLFVDWVRLRQPAFALTDANAAAVATVCHRLDGMPLALELAAACAHVLTMTQLATRLDAALSLLTHGGRTVAPRHQTLRATLDWSYALLTEDERIVLRRLATFAGGCDLAAAEAVCAGDEIARADVLTLLAQLVEKSLVQMEEQHETARYRLFETVRQYAEERLHASGEAERIRQTHADCYRAVAEAAGVALIGRDHQGTMDRLLPEQDNIRNALHWLLDMQCAEHGVRMSTDLWRFFWHFDHFSEGSRWLTAFLALDAESGAERAPTAMRMDALFVAGRLMIGHGAHDEARTPLVEMLTIARRQQDARRISLALTGLGLIAFEQCAFDEARELHEEAITSGRTSGDPFALSQALHNSGTVLLMLGETQLTRIRLEESLDLVRQLGDGEMWHAPSAGMGRLPLSKETRTGHTPFSLRVSRSIARDGACSASPTAWRCSLPCMHSRASMRGRFASSAQWRQSEKRSPHHVLCRCNDGCPAGSNPPGAHSVKRQVRRWSRRAAHYSSRMPS